MGTQTHGVTILCAVFLGCCIWPSSLKHNHRHRLHFLVNDKNEFVPDELTPALEVDGEYRYPCYVSVVVYDTPELLSTYTDRAVVTTLTRNRSDSTYLGYSQSETDLNGHACVLTLCRKDAVIFVEIGSEENGNVERVNAVNKDSQVLPQGFTYELQTRNEEIVFNVRTWGTINGKTGPVYNINQRDACLNAGSTNHHFTYSLLGVKDKLTTTLSVEENYQPMSWYYESSLSHTHQVCFMKIKVKTTSYQAKVELSSYTEQYALYGTYEAGPKPSPTSQDTSTKAACMEFRCAVLDDNDNKMNTVLVGRATVPSLACNCAIRNEPSKIANFPTTITVNDNYGAEHGIYKHRIKSHALQMCLTGQTDYLPDYEMEPEKNIFLEFDCTVPCT